MKKLGHILALAKYCGTFREKMQNLWFTTNQVTSNQQIDWAFGLIQKKIKNYVNSFKKRNKKRKKKLITNNKVQQETK